MSLGRNPPQGGGQTTLAGRVLRPVRPGLAYRLLILGGLCLLAFSVRVFNLNGLSVQGDYAYSVYAAARDLATIAAERSLDSHPPLYYYVLHFWMIAAGQSEYAVRLPSAFAGLLLVPLTYRLAAGVAGGRAGAVAALLTALSPALVEYSRVPRMYTLLALFALASTYALRSAVEEHHGAKWGQWALVTLAALFTHYYALALVAAQMVYVLWHRRADAGRLRRPLIAAAAIMLAYAPWLAFAALGAAAATSHIISNAPWPQTVQGVAEMYWIPLNLADYLDLGESRVMAVGFGALLAVLLVEGRTYLWPRRAQSSLLASVLLLPIGVSLALFTVLPYAVRPRFLLFSVPLYLVVLAITIASVRRWLAAGALVLLVAAYGFALAQLYAQEPFIIEVDAVALNDRLEAAALPGDAVVLQAFWQQGYLAAHYRGAPLAIHSLREVPPEGYEATLAGRDRVWLAMFRTYERDPDYPLEEWLDRRWHRADRVHFFATRLTLYVRPSEDAWQIAETEFAPPGGEPELRLAAIQPAHRTARPGEALAIGLRWQAKRAITERYVPYLQLVDASGRRWAGNDGEPVGGTHPTAGWTAGQTNDDRRALNIPPDTPPGEYAVRAGVYVMGQPDRALEATEAGKKTRGGVTIGQVRVDPRPADELRPEHPLEISLADGIALRGYDLDIDNFQIAYTRTVTAQLDNPLLLSYPKDAYTPGETATVSLYWQALAAPDRDYTTFVYLVGERGQMAARAEGQPVYGTRPTSGWQPGDTMIDPHRLTIPTTTPPGRYRLLAGIYERSTMEGTPVSEEDRPAEADTISLGTLIVSQPRPMP